MDIKEYAADKQWCIEFYKVIVNSDIWTGRLYATQAIEICCRALHEYLYL